MASRARTADVAVEAAYSRAAWILIDGRAWEVQRVDIVEEGDSAFLTRHARLTLRDLLSADVRELVVYATDDLALAPAPRRLVMSHRAGRGAVVLRDPETHEDLMATDPSQRGVVFREGDAVLAIVANGRVVGFVAE